MQDDSDQDDEKIITCQVPGMGTAVIRDNNGDGVIRIGIIIKDGKVSHMCDAQHVPNIISSASAIDPLPQGYEQHLKKTAKRRVIDDVEMTVWPLSRPISVDEYIRVNHAWLEAEQDAPNNLKKFSAELKNRGFNDFEHFGDSDMAFLMAIRKASNTPATGTAASSRIAQLPPGGRG